MADERDVIIGLEDHARDASLESGGQAFAPQDEEGAREVDRQFG